MGTYYHLLNDTKRHKVHLTGHVKRGPMTLSNAVHFALCNYMMVNQGDTFRLCSDNKDDSIDYVDIDLLSYDFGDGDITREIVDLLNIAHGSELYTVVNGIGFEIP